MITDFQYKSRYKVVFNRIPNLTFSITNLKIPNVMMNPAHQPTPITPIARPGDQIDYTSLDLSFILFDNLDNYEELYNWMLNTSAVNGLENKRELIKTKTLTDDITVSILDSTYNAKKNIIFHDAFPIYLSGWDFNTAVEDLTPIIISTSFAFSYFEIEKS